MKKGLKRGLSLVSALLMVISMMSVNVLAEDLNVMNEEIVNQESLGDDGETATMNPAEMVNLSEEIGTIKSADNLIQIESAESMNELGNWMKTNIVESEIDQITDDHIYSVKGEIDQTLETMATESGFEYTDYMDGVCITRYIGDPGVEGYLISPATLGGKKVLKIGDGAFSENTTLTRISLPSTVTDIGKGAFYQCDQLIDILLGRELVTIEEVAFYGCSSLKNVVLPDSVTSIGQYAFALCSGLTKVYGFNNGTTIETGAFARCASLTSMVIPNTVTAMGDGVFAECGALTDVTLPNTITTIGEYLFQSCVSLTGITLPDSVVAIGEGAFSYCSGLTDVTLPIGLVSIGGGTFYDCSNLASIILPNTVVTIGESAFEFCDGLIDFTIPEQVTSIGKYALASCGNLIKVGIPPNVTSIGAAAFSDSNLVSIYGVKGSYAESYANANSIPFVDPSRANVKSFTTDKTSGQYVNTDITLTAIGIGGQTPYQYKFYYKIGMDTAVIQEYGDINTATFRTANAGNYILSVDIKDADGSVATKSIENYSVVFKCTYQTHVQNVGWQGWKNEGEISGTSALGLRLEGIEITVDNQGYDIGVDYQTHVENIGWQGFKSNGDMSGTSGKALRLEAIQIKLTGTDADKCDIYYQVHAQNYGWLGWAKNGESAGTEGFAYRLEAIKIVVVPKGDPAPGTTDQPFVKNVYCSYQTHIQNIGWQGWMSKGDVSGTSGKSLRLEGIEIKTSDPTNLGIEYQTHVQNLGWQDFKSNGEKSGTSGKSLRLEAIQIKLTGVDADKYDIYYQVHAQNYGWLGWAKNGESAGTEGFGYRLEAIKIVVVPKGSAAPGSTIQPFVKK
jgi:uncharacterized protein YjdB